MKPLCMLTEKMIFVDNYCNGPCMLDNFGLASESIGSAVDMAKKTLVRAKLHTLKIAAPRVSKSSNTSW